MYCTHCGHENPAEANFCGQCGQPLRRAAEAGSSTTTSGLRVDEAGVSERAETEVEPEVSLGELALGTALLVVVRGPNEGARFLLDRNVVTVGRHPDSDIFLDDVTVSRRHAEFRREGSRFSVHDVGSLNGTYVNGERTDDRPLVTGDEVQIGKFKLAVFVGGTDR
jgi:pSer/pThr/pTyr-binding forkhead associated (FHA) protein